MREQVVWALHNGRIIVVQAEDATKPWQAFSAEVENLINRVTSAERQLNSVRSSATETGSSEESVELQVDMTIDGDPTSLHPSGQSQPATANIQRELFPDEGTDSSSTTLLSDRDVLLQESEQPGAMDSDANNPRPGSQIDDALAKLTEALDKGHSEQLKQFLKTLSKFHHYSFGNVLLISQQMPEATHVAGFHAWKNFGRSVRKGEKGIAILAPIVRRKKMAVAETESVEITEDDDADRDSERAVGFRTAYVFDVSQTDGEPLPEFPSARGDPGILLSRLRASIVGRGIHVKEELIPGGALGMAVAGEITIRPGLSNAEQFRVLAHEIAHIYMRQGERRSETTKTIRETEAEAVAFAVCHAAGLDANTSSSDYIQLYNGSVETLSESLEYIRCCTNEILAELGLDRQ